MKKHRLVLILLLVYLFGYSRNASNIQNAFFPNDSIAKGKFMLHKYKDTMKLIIEYNISYSGVWEKNNLNQFFNFDSVPKGKRTRLLTVKGIKDSLLKIISITPGLELEPQYPSYVMDIFSLIRGKEKKLKAKQLYISNNPEDMIATSTQQNFLSQNGKYTNTMNITFTCMFKPITKPVRLAVPEFFFMYDNQIYTSEVLIIDL